VECVPTFKVLELLFSEECYWDTHPTFAAFTSDNLSALVRLMVQWFTLLLQAVLVNPLKQLGKRMDAAVARTALRAISKLHTQDVTGDILLGI
jgi:hypothetical protein